MKGIKALAILLFCFCVNAYAAEEKALPAGIALVNESFGVGIDSDMTLDNWVCDITADGNARLSDGALRLTQSKDGIMGVSYGLRSLCGDSLLAESFVVRMDIKVSSGTFFTMPYILDKDNKVAAAVVIENEIFAYNGPKKQLISVVRTGEWMNISLLVTPELKTYDVFIDEVCIASDLKFKDSDFSYADRVYFSVNNAGAVGVDNFSIITTNLSAEIISQVSFSDISENHWAKKYISALASEGIMKGTGENLFSPKNLVTVAEIAVMFARINKTPAEGTTWYDVAMKAMENEGIIINTAPDYVPMRYQLCGYIARALENAGKLNVKAIDGRFTDISALSQSEQDNITRLSAAGIINGITETEFAPYETVTREQTAKIIYQYIQLMRQ